MVCFRYLPTISAVILVAHAARVVVDDSDLARWTYRGLWTAASGGCTACFQLNASRVSNGTWHEAGNVASAQLSFTGTALEIYAVCSSPKVSPNQAAYGINLTFVLDSLPDGTFRGPEPTCSETVYDYLVYARRNLPLTGHTFTVSNSPVLTNANTPDLVFTTSELLLDYAIYDDGKPTSSQSSSTSTIAVASVLGPLLFFFIGLSLWLWWKMYKRPPVGPIHITEEGHRPMIDSTPLQTPYRGSQQMSYTPTSVQNTYPEIAQPVPEPAWHPAPLLQRESGYTFPTPQGPAAQDLRPLGSPPHYHDFQQEQPAPVPGRAK